MLDKTISVPLEHYLFLACLGAGLLAYLTDKPDRTAEDDADLARAVRWEQWHDAVEERGLTRP